MPHALRRFRSRSLYGNMSYNECYDLQHIRPHRSGFFCSWLSGYRIAPPKNIRTFQIQSTSSAQSSRKLPSASQWAARSEGSGHHGMLTCTSKFCAAGH
jgi:hypothetical protein